MRTTTVPPATARIDVRRADSRFDSKISWLDSHHSFSFGHHYDPANTHHGLLLVNNDDTVTQPDQCSYNARAEIQNPEGRVTAENNLQSSHGGVRGVRVIRE